MPDVIDLANQFAAALERKDTAALNRIIRAYVAIQDRLQDKIDALTLAIGADQPTPAQLERMARFRALIAQTEAELDKFSGYLATEIEQAARLNIGIGASDARRLVEAIYAQNGGVLAGFNRLPTQAIEKLLGFLDADVPLYKRLMGLGQFTAQGMRAAILEGVGLGYNPRKIAAEIQRTLGVGLSDALRTTRTAQIYAYREANRAIYAANSDVVIGWYWSAHFDDRVCMSCVAMHGTFHPLSEPLDDHYNGRCAPIPAVKEADNPIQESGEDWFNNLSEAQQRELMGPGRYEAWKDGRFSFEQLSKEGEDDVYGKMRTEASLADLIGE